MLPIRGNYQLLANVSSTIAQNALPYSANFICAGNYEYELLGYWRFVGLSG
jgi:hypothetical protein